MRSIWRRAKPLRGAMMLGAAGVALLRGAATVRGESSQASIPPDPAPLSERMQWQLDLRWERGTARLVAAERVDMGQPRETPRMMGRFALELFQGPTLVERLRFDFPLLGTDDDADAGSDASAAKRVLLARKLTTATRVLFPASQRGTTLQLWDRATNVRTVLPWPPNDDSADAGYESRDR